MNSAIESDDGYPLLKEQVQKTFNNWESELTSLIIQGQETGEFNSSADPSGLAKFFIATLEGTIMLARSTQNNETFNQVLDKLDLIMQKELKL